MVYKAHYYVVVPVGSITSLARLSVRLSVLYGLVTHGQKVTEKPKLVWTFPSAEVTGMPFFQFKISKIKVKDLQKMMHILQKHCLCWNLKVDFQSKLNDVFSDYLHYIIVRILFVVTDSVVWQLVLRHLCKIWKYFMNYLVITCDDVYCCSGTFVVCTMHVRQG